MANVRVRKKLSGAKPPKDFFSVRISIVYVDTRLAVARPQVVSKTAQTNITQSSVRYNTVQHMAGDMGTPGGDMLWSTTRSSWRGDGPSPDDDDNGSDKTLVDYPLADEKSTHDSPNMTVRFLTTREMTARRKKKTERFRNEL